MAAEDPQLEQWLAFREAHVARAREPRASGTGPDPETLRRAYLDLLKLSLCDLAASSTVSLGAQPDGTVTSRELRGDERRLRSAGMDWPLHGLTMIGLGRLDDLQSCVESIVADGVEGDVIETGAWRGGASILVRATLDSLGDERTVWVADSFQGFHAGDGADSEAVRLSAFDHLAVPLEEVRDNFARFGCDRNVRFVPGFFEDTLADLAGERWSMVRLDADTYEPTRLGLEHLYPGLVPGGYLIVDDYGSFQGCRQAVDQYRAAHGIAERLEAVDSTCVRWRRASAAAPTGWRARLRRRTR
jgi:O-methyltransferase